MSELLRFRRDIAWNLVPVALLAVVGLGSQFAIGAWWGAAALGVFNLVTIAVFVFAALGAAGLQFAVLRAVAEEPDDPARVAAVVVGALVPNLAFAALAAGLAVALHAPIGRLLASEHTATGLLYAAPGIACFSINKILLAIVNGRRRMRAFAIYTSLRYAMIAVGVVGARAIGATGAQLGGIWTFVELVVFVALAGETLATITLARAAGWRAWIGRHVRFGVRGVGATLVAEINGKLDIWMVGVVLPEAQVGIYSLASALYEGALQVAVVAQNLTNPIVARELAAGRRDEVRDLARRTRRWFVPTMLAGGALGAAIYPFAIPWLVGDPAFRAGAVPFAILMVGVVLASPMLPFTQILMMAGRPGWHTVYLVAVVALAFVADLVLIPLLGMVGAGIATAGALVASATLVRVLAAHVKAW